MRIFALAIISCLFWSCAAAAAPAFPLLSGHVVDDAHVFSPAAAASLEQNLIEYENGTSNQVVVVTLSSLQGYAIDDYGYQLGRYWRIGQKGKDNGVLLIVAPHERKARIEVGYGLEPILTDAASSAIIEGVILPQFRAGHVERGIVEGTREILSVLGGKAVPVPPPAQSGSASAVQSIFSLIMLVLFICFAVRHPFIALFLLSNTSRFGSSRMNDAGWGGGGFSGGGGSFGGGGSSGSW